MLVKIKETEKFKNEIKFFKSKIKKIESDNIKKLATKLLESLISQTTLIDEGHSSKNNGYIDPRRVRDNMENLYQIRLQLKKIIEDLDNA